MSMLSVASEAIHLQVLPIYRESDRPLGSDRMGTAFTSAYVPLKFF
jgi:hypothetical protein